MKKVFITGSTVGLGQLTAQALLERGGYEVTLHARNNERAKVALKNNPTASHVVIGDLSDPTELKSIAKQVNELGTFDTIIHNAGISSINSKQTLAVNVIAPYVLTVLINRPKRLIFVSSGMHRGAKLDLETLQNTLDYSGSKLALLLLMKYVAKLWPSVITNAVDPGWVPTRMGGPNATDNLQLGFQSQLWLATSDDNQAQKSGNYYYHGSLSRYDERIDKAQLQQDLVTKLTTLTGIKLDSTNFNSDSTRTV